MPSRIKAYWLATRNTQILINMPVPMMGYLICFKVDTVRFLPLLLFLLSVYLLFAHILIYNNYQGFDQDIADPGKFFTRGYPHLSRNGLLVYSMLLLLVSIISGLFISATFLITVILTAVLWALYSGPPLYAKFHYYSSTIIHLISGFFHFALGTTACGCSPVTGLFLALFFGLAITAGQLTQEIVDIDPDKRAGVKSIAIILGARKSFSGSVLLFALAGMAAACSWLTGGISFPESMILMAGNGLIVLRGLIDGRRLAREVTAARYVIYYRYVYLIMGLLFLTLHLWNRKDLHSVSFSLW